MVPPTFWNNLRELGQPLLFQALPYDPDVLQYGAATSFVLATWSLEA